mmetsp:Transcript_22203/g.64471  ORF Transcript_22203/g.64471 Transcript_22203/m.64471 type:complete len:450 (-) Transcript_22203:148-1497(-)
MGRRDKPVELLSNPLAPSLFGRLWIHCRWAPSACPPYALEHVGLLELLVPEVEADGGGDHAAEEEEEGEFPTPVSLCRVRNSLTDAGVQHVLDGVDPVADGLVNGTLELADALVQIAPDVVNDLLLELVDAAFGDRFLGLDLPHGDLDVVLHSNKLVLHVVLEDFQLLQEGVEDVLQAMEPILGHALSTGKFGRGQLQRLVLVVLGGVVKGDQLQNIVVVRELARRRRDAYVGLTGPVLVQWQLSLDATGEGAIVGRVHEDRDLAAILHDDLGPRGALDREVSTLLVVADACIAAFFVLEHHFCGLLPIVVDQRHVPVVGKGLRVLESVENHAKACEALHRSVKVTLHVVGLLHHPQGHPVTEELFALATDAELEGHAEVVRAQRLARPQSPLLALSVGSQANEVRVDCGHSSRLPFPAHNLAAGWIHRRVRWLKRVLLQFGSPPETSH